MTGRRYKRVWRVTAYRAKPGAPGGFVNTHSDFFEALPNGIEVTKLRVQFSVEKTLDKEPNVSTVVITNLAEGTRADLCRKPLIVRVEAGHEEDEGLRLLFQGDLRYGFSKQEGTDWSTELQLADASRAYQHARVKQSFKAGTSALVALRAAARSMGVALPRNVEEDPALGRAFAAGVSLEGPARDQMTRLLRPYGYSWSFQNGRLVVLKDGELDAGRAILISQETGMLGSPEFGAPEADGKPPTLKVRSMLYPQVNPGQMLDVRGRGIDGIFRAERVTHTGDSHGDDWHTEIDAKPANAKRA